MKNLNAPIPIFLIIVFIVNLILGATLGLSYDESYYWMYSKFLAWGYYDHPPMVALMIKIGTSLSDSEFGVRLIFNIMSTASLWIMWDLTSKTKSFVFAVVALSLPLVQSAGFLALPDTPLMFFSLLFLWLTNKYIKNDSNILGILIAVVISMLFYSKYHGLLVVILTVLAVPEIIKRKSFWLIIILTVLFYLPHMYWQYTNDFVTFDFHLNGRGEKHFDVQNILNYLTSQIALFGTTLFITFIILIKKINFQNKLERILSFNVIGFLVILFFMSFRNQIEANWTVTACAYFGILMVLLFEKIEMSKYKILALGILPVTLIFIIRVILFLPDSFYEGKKIGRLNEVKGWDKRIKFLVEATKDLPVVAETYQYGAKVSFELRQIIPVEHFRGRDSHYTLLKLTKNMKKDSPIYYLTPRKQDNGVKIETGYKDPLYIIKTTLDELEQKHRR